MTARQNPKAKSAPGDLAVQQVNPGEKPSPREEFRALVRQRIIDASMTCFQERGYGVATMDLIAKSAGISRTAIYQYFRFKREILYEGVLQSEPQWIAVSAAALPLQARGMKDVRSGIVQMFDMYKRNIAFLRVIIEAASTEPSVSDWLEAEFQKHVGDVARELLKNNRKTPLAQNHLRMRVWIAVTAMDNVFRRVLDPRWSLNEEVAIDEIARMWLGIIEAHGEG